MSTKRERPIVEEYLEEKFKQLRTPGWFITKEAIKTVPDNLITGNNARLRRLHRKLSLRSLAKRIGVSAAFLSDLELGRRNWSPEFAAKYEEALNPKD